MNPVDLLGDVRRAQHIQRHRLPDQAGKKAPILIRTIQIDNGTEFTNALLVTKSKHKTMFETALMNMGIEYHRIRIATSRHNGKVERQHRTDETRFYKKMRMYCLEDGRRQLSKYQAVSND